MSMGRSARWVLALALGGGPGWAHGAEPVGAPTAGAPPEGTELEHVVVDASEIGTLSIEALTEISHSATLRASEHGLGPDQMRVSLVVLDHLEAVRGVRVSIVTPTHALVSEDGDPRGPLVAQCTACAEAELMTLSTEGVLTALRRYDDMVAPPPVAASEPALEPEPSVAAEAPTERQRAPLGRLGWAGVVPLSVGGAAIVTGVVLASLGQRPPAIETAQDLLRDYPTPGYVLLGVGGALVITGAVLLGVDRKRTQGHARAKGPGSVGLTLAPRGVALRGRF